MVGGVVPPASVFPARPGPKIYDRGEEPVRGQQVVLDDRGQLRELFSQHDTVTKVQFIDREIGQPRGFAVVGMSDGADQASTPASPPRWLMAETKTFASLTAVMRSLGLARKKPEESTPNPWCKANLKNLTKVEELLDWLEDMGYAEQRASIVGDTFVTRWR